MPSDLLTPRGVDDPRLLDAVVIHRPPPIVSTTYDNDNESLNDESPPAITCSLKRLAPIRARLRQWGYCGIQALLQRYTIIEIEDVLAEVDAAKNAASDRGQFITNPGGLFRKTLYESYGKR